MKLLGEFNYLIEPGEFRKKKNVMLIPALVRVTLWNDNFMRIFGMHAAQMYCANEAKMIRS